MRTTTTTSLGVLAIGAGSLVGLTPTTAHAGTTTHEHQRGIVLECTGHNRDHSAYVDLYENDRHGNYVQVIIDDDPKRSASKDTDRALRTDGEVRAGILVKGQRARVRGTATVFGARQRVHEVHDDAGNHIVVNGYHRKLDADLVLRYDGGEISLTCAPAFVYSLDVATTPIG